MTDKEIELWLVRLSVRLEASQKDALLYAEAKLIVNELLVWREYLEEHRL